ncbi:MAG: SLBB domain-containing protein [Verrucomicrobia bacterium]|nr:SLBB domain-containing protein [Verrucomicrobiota bacterium]
MRSLYRSLAALVLAAATTSLSAQIVQRRELPPRPNPNSGQPQTDATTNPGGGAPATRVAEPVPASSAPSALIGTIQSMAGLDTRHRLGAGDRLTYRVVEDKDKPVGIQVTDSGEVEVPYYGRVRAQGKSCMELAQLIKSRLEQDLYYKATVIVALDSIGRQAAVSPGRVYLTGAVRSPGAIEMPGDEKLTVSKAILRVGGFADFGNQKKVMLIRKAKDGKSTTTIVDVRAILEGQLEKDVELEPGDTIRVPERTLNIGF